jgi:TP901-1 family phage major tail protein
MAGKNGSDVLLLVNTGTASVPVYEAVASQRDVDFSETTEEIDVSSKDSRAKRVLPGRYGSTISLESLYVETSDDYNALKDAMRDGNAIKIGRQDDGVTMETADAIITDMTETFPDQGESTISISLTIDGFWTELVS